MAATMLKRSPLTAATITPPSINRQHSYREPEQFQRTSNFKRMSSSSSSSSSLSYSSQSDATSALRAVSPRRKDSNSSTANGSVATTPLDGPSPRERGSSAVSWEECLLKRDGYVSFPDFDQLRAEAEERLSLDN